MTVSPNARTPSASVHALSGSTPPGTGSMLKPFGTANRAVVEMPDTFAPLGAVAADVVAGLASRRAAVAHPDAEVIDLAERVKGLALREHRLWGRTADIEDAASAAMPPRPTRLETDLRFTAGQTVRHDGAVITSIVEPPGWAHENAACAGEHEAAEATWKRGLAEEEARRALPFWEKLRARATARLSRWGQQLASLEPVTSAGVAAKAAASTAVTENGSPLDPWRQQLISSLSRDALRIICAEAGARAEQDRQVDGELLALGRAWEVSCGRYERACADDDARSDAIALIAPPEELFNRPGETGKLGPYPNKHLSTGRYWYGEERTIEVLRRMALGGRMDVRRNEILAAYDKWRADLAAENDRSGFTAGQAELKTACDENAGLRARICLMPARTPAGVDLKLRVILWLHDGLDVLADEMGPGNVDHPEFSAAIALSLVLDLARQRSGAEPRAEREERAA